VATPTSRSPMMMKIPSEGVSANRQASLLQVRPRLARMPGKPPQRRAWLPRHGRPDRFRDYGPPDVHQIPHNGAAAVVATSRCKPTPQAKPARPSSTCFPGAW
jgi:hypothetical protein